MSLNSWLINHRFGTADKKRDAGRVRPEGLSCEFNIPYVQMTDSELQKAIKRRDPSAQLLDIYYPDPSRTKAPDKDFPVLVNIHGGAWVYGSKYVYEYYLMDMALRGFFVINFSYRLAPKHKYPAQLVDINSVLMWLFENGEKYPCDLSRVFLMGDSAGAHLASMYACAKSSPAYQTLISSAIPTLAPIDIRALALTCGSYTMSWDNLCLRDLLKSRSEMNLVCPLDYITDAFPRCFVMTSDGDFLRKDARHLLDKLNAHNIPHKFALYSKEKTYDADPGDTLPSSGDVLYHVFHCDFGTKSAIRANNDIAEYLLSL